MKNLQWQKRSAVALLGAIILAGSSDAIMHTDIAAAASAKSKNTYEQSAVPQVISRMSPSVVGIIGKAPQGSSEVDDRYNLAHGTGVIWKSDGWIVTNAHVVDGLTGITVVTSDGKSYKAKSVYSDPMSDIALVKINAKSLKPAKFAASAQNALVGETVVAIGTPISFSLRNSASVGVVSGLNRSVDGSYRLIQTDTAINPGNSGGPLVNLKGEVIGINSKKFAAVGIENMGFSIPAETVHYIVDHLLEYGEVRRAGLGLELEESWSAIVGLPSDDPLTVTKVLSEQARKAGIQEDDVLYAINGKRIYSVVDINERLKPFIPGQQVQLLMQRDGDIVNVKLTLSQDGNRAASSSVEEAESW
ncbi:trypsin-like peptidase domain-containing protein [Paenibacillus sp. EZ-K15]|uniref:S1C family serine protease n=1 Tax=Paenibacillus sp. EZ-K15 TaxID=2044275 RepID=UPI000BFA7BC6|nr:trypsin-like peptidase domain-containing protein [Paenibacillus sp. EZ-K15]